MNMLSIYNRSASKHTMFVVSRVVSVPYNLACVETWGSWFKRHGNQASFLDKNHPTIKHVVYDGNETITACGYYGIDELLQLPPDRDMKASAFIDAHKDPWTATASTTPAVMECPLADTFDCEWNFQKKTHSGPMKATWKYENGHVTITFDDKVVFGGAKRNNTWQSTDFFADERQRTLANLKLARNAGV